MEHYYVGDRNTVGARHGKGFAKFPNGDVYLGEYQNNQKHGVGIYCFKDGHRYIGQYRHGVRSGHGKFIYPDGSMYDGNWYENKKHGEGTYFYENGDIYTGNWRNDVRYGQGVMEFQDGCQLYCTWDNFPNGQCEIKYPTYTYYGTWNHPYPIGPGMFSFNKEFFDIGFYMLDNSCNPPKHVWVSQDIVKYDDKLIPERPVPPTHHDTDETSSEKLAMSVQLVPPPPHETDESSSEKSTTSSQELSLEGEHFNLESDSNTLNQEAMLEELEEESSDTTSSSMEDVY